MYKTRRSAILSFLLSLITFGIFGIIQLFILVGETNQICKEYGKKTMNPIIAWLLSIITFGIFGIIWGFGLIARINTYVMAHKEKPRLTATSWLLSLFLGAFTLFIWNIIVFFKQYALWNQMNKIANEEAKPAN